MIQDPHSNSVALVQPLEPADRAEDRLHASRIEHAHDQQPRAAAVAERRVLPVRLLRRRALRPRALPAPAPRRPGRHADRLGAPVHPHRRPDRHARPAGRDERSTSATTSATPVRDEEGTQTPLETLEAAAAAVPRLRAADDGSGAPARRRDALRLGLPLRPGARRPRRPRRARRRTVGAGSTHAWLQAYLPGAGWVPFDPTNNLLGGNQLIRVGVARDPSQAAPIAGSWYGEPRRLPRHDGQRGGEARAERRSTAPTKKARAMRAFFDGAERSAVEAARSRGVAL